MENRVAIVSYAFRFPGTTDQNFWDDLVAKRSLITKVDPSRWSHDVFLHPDKRHPGTSYTFAAGSLGDISGFDASFFGISPREATLMDPQQRMLLELAWETFENAGVVPTTLRGSDCGVYIGISSADGAYRLADDLAALDSASATGYLPSIAANRISYVYDLRGPSVAVDTACSSSMVAFHQAYQAIKSGEITQALTGGINLHLHPYGFITFSKATMLSKTGRCHVFDASADGYVRSEGGGLFLLKNYQQAVADGDQVLAIIAGSMVNTDGHKSGLTIPSAEIQAGLLERVYKQAKIDPNEIDYLEAHGTGTPVGDPIEAYAIGLSLGQRRTTPLPIGSIKSNLGHLEPASGVAGLVKALGCIKNREVPGTAGLETLNPQIRCKEWNINIPTETMPLKQRGKLILGVNSFGFGGANAHVIIESPDEIKRSSKNTVVRLDRNPLPLVLSVKDAKGLAQTAGIMANFLNNLQENTYYDVAYTAYFHRERHAHSALIFASSPKEATEQLMGYAQEQATQESSVIVGNKLAHPKGPVFVYSGNGCQWEAMGKRLLEQSQIFRRIITEIDRHFKKYSNFSLLDEIAGLNGENRYGYTEIAQPALFAIQVGVTEVLRESGIQPVAVIGHSVGEVAAAWASGILSLSSAVKVIYFRSHHQGRTKGSGQMLAVSLGCKEIQVILDSIDSDLLCIAGINSYRGVTIVGSIEELTALEAELHARNVLFKRLDLDYAFHCKAMDAIKADLVADIGSLSFNHLRLPFYSTVTGSLIFGDKLDAEYWWHNVREPVRFQQALNAIVEGGFNTFIEIGSHPILRTYLLDSLKENNVEGAVIPTLLRNKDSLAQLMKTVGLTLLSGVEVDTKRWFPVNGQFIKLPNYVWQKDFYKQPVTSESYGLLARELIHPLLGYSLKQHNLTWENQLDTQILPYLADHNVGGAIVFPGAGFVEVVLAAAHELYPENDSIEIEDLEIQLPLLLSEDHTKVIRAEIRESDGQIKLRSRALANGDEWTQHLIGRIIPAATGSKLEGKGPLLPKREADFDLSSHTTLTEKVGLQYGPAFQAITHGWSDNTSALGVFVAPDSVKPTLGRYYLHPGFLDCAFQMIFQMLKKEIFSHEGIAFVPIKFGRIHLRTNKALPVLVTAKLLRRSPHSLVAEFVLFDNESKAIAVLSDVRFRAIRLNKQNKQSADYLDYHLTAAPLPHHSGSLNRTPLIQIEPFLNEAVNAVQHDFSSCRFNNEVEPLLDSLCLQLAVETLSKFTDSQGFLTRSSVNQPGFVDNHHVKLYQLIVDIAVKSQLLTQIEDNVWELNATALEKDLSAKSIWSALVGEYPDYFYPINLAGRVAIHLEDIIRGSVMPEQLDLSAKLYDRLIFQVLEQTCRKQLSGMFQSYFEERINLLPSGERLSILEISSFKPLFASSICTQLDFKLCDYRFASFCDEAINQAELLREHFPLLDVRKLPLVDTQSARIHQRRLSNFAVVTLNSISLKDIKAMLIELPTLLVAGSQVLFIGQHPADWLDIVLGASGNQCLEGLDGEALSPQLTALQVSEQLESLGFTDTNIVALGSNNYSSGTYVITAHIGPSLAMPKVETNKGNWLLVAGQFDVESKLAEAIAYQLRSQGHNAVHHVFKNGTLLVDELTNAKYNHIVHLYGLGNTDVDMQTGRCSLVAKIVQICESTRTDATLWLLTSQVGSIVGCDQKNTRFADKGLANDAVLWGFGRSLMNEASNYRVRMLDINGDFFDVHVLDAIVTELLNSNSEQEVVLSSDGKRFVPRLRLEQDPQMSPVVETDLVQRLGFKFPGQLRNLCWEYSSPVMLSEDEVEVEVKATGLNFRDVMYTLGLLSDEAVENGFVGSTLGLEFAGKVIGLGKKVKKLKVGDRVVGFGSASFSNRVVTKSGAIVAIPNEIDFSAAATIPSTFFTAYYALVTQARLQPGEKVLIHGAAGGVGIAAVQIAKWIGAEIYATVSSVEKRDFLRMMGVEHIHDSRKLSFAEEILAKTDNGVDVVLNSLAGEAINRNFQVLKPFGRFLELGKRDFYENTHIGLRPFRNNISYFGIDADQLMLERPKLAKEIFGEIMKLFEEGVLHPLPYTVFDSNQVVEAFRHMQQAKQIGKIVVVYDNGIKTKPRFEKIDRPTLKLSSQASYLVTGGLGGFGLKTAQWLVEKGAQNLVLLSRSGPVSEESQSILKSFAKQGINVYAEACDVTDKAALTEVLTKIEASMPPLKGVIHAAAVIDDGLVRNTTHEQISTILAPKIQGALNLHDLTRNREIDFFILYSSATTLFGNPGQGSYVAANHWLEALTSYRRKSGLPATCIRWGAIGDTGYLARNEKIKETLQSRMGGSLLSSDKALNIMEQLILSNSGTLGVLDMDWHALGRFLPTAQADKFFEIASQSQDIDPNTDSKEDIQRLLEELSDEDLKSTFIEMIKQELSQILLLSVDKIDANQSVYDMGMDSLMGVELMVAIESRFGIQIPVMALSEASTLNKLVDKLILQLRGEDAEASNPLSASTSTINDLVKLHGSDATSDQIAAFTEQLNQDNSQNRIVN